MVLYSLWSDFIDLSAAVEFAALGIHHKQIACSINGQVPGVK